jgi:two-component system LytT family response regulator
MEPVNYSYTLPLDHSNQLEVTFKVHTKQTGLFENSSLLSTFNTTHPSDHNEIVLSGLNELPGNIIHAIKEAHLDFLTETLRPQTFMASTATGFQLLRLNQIVYFEYLTDKKLWTVFLSNQMQLTLRRNTNAEAILNYSSNFIQLNHHQIINMDYLVKIEQCTCQLSTFIGNEIKLIISRNYLKEMIVRMKAI